MTGITLLLKRLLESEGNLQIVYTSNSVSPLLGSQLYCCFNIILEYFKCHTIREIILLNSHFFSILKTSYITNNTSMNVTPCWTVQFGLLMDKRLPVLNYSLRCFISLKLLPSKLWYPTQAFSPSLNDLLLRWKMGQKIKAGKKTYIEIEGTYQAKGKRTSTVTGRC